MATGIFRQSVFHPGIASRRPFRCDGSAKSGRVGANVRSGAQQIRITKRNQRDRDGIAHQRLRKIIQPAFESTLRAGLDRYEGGGVKSACIARSELAMALSNSAGILDWSQCLERGHARASSLANTSPRVENELSDRTTSTSHRAKARGTELLVADQRDSALGHRACECIELVVLNPFEMPSRLTAASG